MKSARGTMRMTMADMADLADATPGAYRLENADTYLTPAPQVTTISPSGSYSTPMSSRRRAAIASRSGRSPRSGR